jgi:hypothetical protein
MPAAKTIKTTPEKTAKKSAPKAPKKVTLDDVWATIDRIGKAQEETQKAHQELQKAHQELQKAHKETQEENQKAHRELQKALKETQRIVGDLGNKFGSLAEHIMTPDLPNQFRKYGFSFTRITRVKWADGENNIYTEIDGLLENGAQAVVVEVKVTLRPEDIDDHLTRMERVRAYADLHNDKREFFGAIAATIVDRDTKIYAQKQGFFVIEPSGEDVKVSPPFSAPKAW